MHLQPSLEQQVFEHQTSAILVISRELTILKLNPAAEDLFGVSGQQCLGQGLAELFVESESVFANLASTPLEQSFTHRQQSLVLRGGNRLIVDLTVVPMETDGHLLIEIQPLDRLLRINQDDRLINVQETTTELVRGLAHEVKNPLAGIRGAAQLLERTLDDERLSEFTNVIIRETDRLTGLVDTMLGPNRIPKIAPVNVHKVLEHVAQVAGASLVPDRLRVITFQRDYDPSLPDVDADEDQLIQAFLNIVSNACLALADTPDPRITLRTRALRQFTIAGRRHRLVAQIDVIDNGPGIPEHLQDRIFYPMISGRPDGTGLGLAITQTIVRRHDGILECHSEPGNTQFSVILPLTFEDDSP